MIRKLQPQLGPVCGVFAATLATHNVPFIVVKNMAREEMGFKARWKGPMTGTALRNVLTKLGVKFNLLDIAGVSLKKAAATMLDPTKHYILFVTKHFVTVHDNKAYDQANPDGAPIDKIWCAGRNIIASMEIDRSVPLPKFADLFPDEMFAE